MRKFNSKNTEKLNKYKISYCYGDMGGGRAYRGQELEINADTEIEAAFFYYILMGHYLTITYEQFLKLSYSTQTWGLTIKKLTDIPDVATFHIDKRIKFPAEN